MELVIDVGNSDLVWAIFRRNHIILEGRQATNSIKDEIILLKYFREMLLENDLKPQHIQACIIGCVVPDILQVVSAACTALLNRPPVIADPELYQKLPLKIDKPYEIGADLVANALHAFERFEGAALIIDFGTALTFTGVDKNGHIAGVAIAPGLKTAVSSLQNNTAQLPEIPLVYPSNVLGKNTAEAISAGILIGYEGLISHMIKKFRLELGNEMKVAATGGLVNLLPALKKEANYLSTGFTLEGFHRMLLKTL